MNKEETIFYDIKSIPEEFGLTIEQVFKIYQEERILLWDSSLGQEPKIFDKDFTKKEPFVVDMSSTNLSEATEERIKKVIEDEAGE